VASAQIITIKFIGIKHILSIEFGPIVQVVVNLNLSMIKKNIISGTPLLVKDIQDISNLTSIQPWG
jgi:hypothetical protein